MRTAPLKRTLRFRQQGAAAVEFALVVTVFLALIFGILEFARVLYMYNSLAEVTGTAARAAANIDFNNSAALNSALRRAVLDQATGRLPFGEPVTSANLHVDYMYFDPASAKLERIPTTALSCPARARLNCLASRSGSNCIRAVRVRVCNSVAADGTCDPVQYRVMFPLVGIDFPLPTSTTIVNAETLGYSAGDPLCAAP